MFDIDADPIAPSDIRAHIPNWMLDTLGDSTEAHAAQAFAHHMIGRTTGPARLETVRKHFTANWAFLRALADFNPELFDEVLCAYYERAMTFEDPNSG